VAVSVHRVLIVGARRRKQGLGEFIAQYFHEQGAEICGIVGTSSTSVEEAARHLQQQYGITTQGYTDLATAIEQANPTVVVIASPTGVHRQHLETVAAFGISCLCEKPLFWENDTTCEADEVERLIERFCGEGQLLKLVTQWPETLDEYYSLYPEVKGQPVEQFDMLLGPASSGINMAIDALPHVLSMVHCLTGVGEVQRVEATHKSHDHLNITFDYQHDKGCVAVAVDLVQSPESPRPAGYAINGHDVRRSIQLPEYQLMFTGESGKQVAVEDPLKKLVRRTLADLESRKPTDKKQLIASMIDLKNLVENLQI
jgi:predicted dehydrogenase